MKNIWIIVAVVVAAVVGVIGVYAISGAIQDTTTVSGDGADVNMDNDLPGDIDVDGEDQSGDSDDMSDETDMDSEPYTQSIIGTSVEGRDIVAHHFGNGDTELLLVAGIHGGYSAGTSLLAYEAIDWLSENPNEVPENMRVTIIPVLNVDGAYDATGQEGRFSRADVTSSSDERIASRFNANDVDLNRNFGCSWSADAVWQQRSVSGGTSAFSEPEAAAVRDYVEANTPDAVVAYYSAAGGVYAAGCNGSVTDSVSLTNLYADASGYPAHESFDAYATTGDMTNWLAQEGITVTSVLLSSHLDSEWGKNKAGIQAVIGSLR